ncbi:hypothetical protein [Bosea sp. WAO]|uniref:hypothetical protein n=1 Tax=Bosea sp. WAO TaxID=406341 RepID=UPI000AD0393C|nr:hypothetical protein [Bosea sp. WAO]
MVLKLSSLRANLDREAKGDWVPSLQWPGVEFLVSALTKPSYRIKRDARVQQLSRRYKGQPIPPEKLAPVIGRLYCEEILHGWRGLDIEYSPEAALATLTDPAFRVIVAEVEYCAGRLSEVDPEFTDDAEALGEAAEDDLGKSEAPSAPASSAAETNSAS